MKKIFLLALTTLALCLSGCSSISEEEFETKVNELESTQKEFESTQKTLETAQKELETTQKEFADYKNQIVEDEMKKSGAKAWVETAFGKDAYAIINEKDLYVNIPAGYTLSEESIKSLLNKIFSGASLYTTYYQANPEQLPYDSITIIVLDENTKLDMMSIQFLKDQDGNFTQNTTMINMDDYLKILSYINKALQ